MKLRRLRDKIGRAAATTAAYMVIGAEVGVEVARRSGSRENMVRLAHRTKDLGVTAGRMAGKAGRSASQVAGRMKEAATTAGQAVHRRKMEILSAKSEDDSPY